MARLCTNIRLSKGERALAREAAERVGLPRNTFVRRAAVGVAERILQGEDQSDLLSPEPEGQEGQDPGL